MIPLISQMYGLLQSGSNFPMEIHRVFGIDGNTLSGAIFVLINLGILAFVLSKVLYKPVLKFLSERTARINAQLENAKNDEKDAAALKVEYETKLKDIANERDEILAKARKEAESNKLSMLEDAKAEADAIKARAMKNMEMEQERVQDEMRKNIIDLSSVMAQKFVMRTIDDEMQDSLFNEVIAELDHASFKSTRAKVG